MAQQNNINNEVSPNQMNDSAFDQNEMQSRIYHSSIPSTSHKDPNRNRYLSNSITRKKNTIDDSLPDLYSNVDFPFVSR